MSPSPRRRRSAADRHTPAENAALDEATDMALLASRALVGVAARSLAGVEEEITLRQYRALVLLTAPGHHTVGSVARALDIHPSTASRLCDRLLARGLIERSASPENRREVTLELSRGGRALVRTVMADRRAALRGILAGLEPETRQALIQSLSAFAVAAGEAPNDAWKLGWTA